MATVTTAALTACSALIGASFTYLAVGTGTTAESASHTGLVTEVAASGLSRATGAVTYEDTTHTDDTVQVVKTWTSSGTVTISEVGLFNASSGGTMAFRELLSPTKAVVSGDTYTLTAQLILVDA